MLGNWERDGVKVGERFKAEVQEVVFGGAGLVRLGALVVFVEGVAPHEVILGEITQLKSDYCRAKVIEFLTKSPRRVEPLCRYFGRCPGCSYQHLDYSLECEIKQEQLRHQLQGVLAAPGNETVLQTPIGPADPYHYRNKIVLHVQKRGGETLLGYFGRDNTTVIDIESCPLAAPAIDEKLRELRADRGFFHTLHDRMSLTLRHTAWNGALYWRNQPPGRLSWLKESLEAGTFAVPAGSFFQVNPAGGQALLREVSTWLKRLRVPQLIDAYCGAGVFTVTAALAGVPEVIGVELDAAAVAAAEYNLKQFQCANGRVIAGDAGTWLPELLKQAPAGAVLLVDPPRTGLAARAVQAVMDSSLRGLLYISCNPATLYRDLRKLTSAGFRLRTVRLIDMFPRSAHFEVLTFLSRE